MDNQIDSLDAIKKLGELKELGLVTEEEFQEKKALIFLQDKHEILAATQNKVGISAQIKCLEKVENEKIIATQNVTGSPERLKKKREVKNKQAATISSRARSRHKLKKRRKIENVEGTTTPASNPNKHIGKSGYFSPLFVSLGILVAVCFGSALWFF